MLAITLLLRMIYVLWLVLDSSSCRGGGGGALLLSDYIHFYVGFDTA